MRRLAGIALLLGLLSEVAYAYVLPTSYLLRLLGDRRREQKIKDISLQLTTERVDQGDTIDVHWYLKQPARQRRVEQDGEQRVYVENLGKMASGTPEKLTPLSGPSGDLTALLLMTTETEDDDDEEVKRTVAALKAMGVDTAVTSLGRDGQTLVYIIGARSWEPEKPQLWLDKATFLPVRLIGNVSKGGKSTRLETRMLEYGSPLTGANFPRLIETYEGGALHSRSEVTEIKLNQDLPESLFEVP